MPTDDRVRVVAYWKSDAERALAAEVLGDGAEHFQNAIAGMATHVDIDRLMGGGILVDVEPSAPGAREALPADAERRKRLERFEGLRRYVTPSNERDAFERLPPSPARPVGAPPAAPALAQEGGNEMNVYEVRISRPLDAAIRKTLAEHGLDVLSFEAPSTYRMELTPRQAETVRQWSFVEDVREYSIADTVDPETLRAMFENAPGDDAQLLSDDSVRTRDYTITVHHPRQLARVRTRIDKTDGIELLGESKQSLRIRARPNDPVLAALTDMSEVSSLALFTPPELLTSHVRRLVGVGVTGITEWDGAGETIGVFDSGLFDFDTEPEPPPRLRDLAGRVTRLAWQGGGSADDPNGHGTHVIGIAAGGGKQLDSEARRICGVAPGATVVSVGMVDAVGVHIPEDVGALLTVATERGARIVNLSWGRDTAKYDALALGVDQFVYDHPEVLVVVAAGNAGRAPKGRFQLRSVYSPACAKNVTAVGASCSDRPSDTTWADRATNDPTRWAEAIRRLPISGHPDFPAPLSSRGPNEGWMIKPDLLAPGTQVYSLRVRHGTFYYPPAPKDGDRYAYASGTSMAAPVVAGAAAIVRQYLRMAREVERPSAALLKAILIAGARRVPSVRGENEPPVGYPDFDQGFGRLDLMQVLPHTDAPAHRRLVFADVPTRNADGSPSADALVSLAAANDEHRSERAYHVRVRDGATVPLCIVLTWTDLPGATVQNNLQLEVRTPSGALALGNAEHVYELDTSLIEVTRRDVQVFDKRNTVESVTIERQPSPMTGAMLEPGEYLIRVIAQNTIAPQGYALCICGELETEELWPEPPV